MQDDAPIAVPGAVTLGFFRHRLLNNFFAPNIMISSIEKYTLPMLLLLLHGDVYRTEYGAIFLGLGITVILVILIYLIFARNISSGIAIGSVKE
jgi:multiple sugar transport system permease protein